MKMKNESYAKFWEIYKEYQEVLSTGRRPDIARKVVQALFDVSSMTMTMVIKLCDDQISHDFYTRLKNNKITTDAGFLILRHLKYDYSKVDLMVEDICINYGINRKITTSVLKSYLGKLRNEICISVSSQEIEHIEEIKYPQETYSDIVYLALTEYLARNPIPSEEEKKKKKRPKSKAVGMKTKHYRIEPKT